MAISIFPSTAAEFVSNNFVVDMNDTSNNTADTGGVKQAGPYSMSFSSGDTSFDVYLIDEDGNSVGYSNNTSIVASGLFSTVVILGVAQDEVISFLYQGSVNNADGEGDEPGAGAYLESISPTDLPSIDDTATVIGGNFGADTEIKFESGATVLDAKNITVNNSTELIVTRPDGLIEDDAPYTVRAITTGVPQPTGTNSNILTDAVTAGSDPTWVTTSPLNQASPGTAFSQTLEATDAEGTVTDYSVTAGTLTTGLTLNASTGVLSGTPTTGGSFTFTVTATDDGGNTTPREFEQSVVLATGGTVTDDGGFRYHTFTSTDDFDVLIASLSVEYLAVAGGGGGGQSEHGAGGGAGGLLSGSSTISAGTTVVTIGAGGAAAINGSSSSLGAIAVPTGGGHGGNGFAQSGDNGGSGGGAGANGGSLGTGTAGQGNDGGAAPGGTSPNPGGGGGAGANGQDGNPSSPFNSGDGGVGLEFAAFASATTTGDGGFYAGGGGGGGLAPPSGGTGGTGGGGDAPDGAGLANTGGGGAGGDSTGGFTPGGAGGSGLVIVRYAI